MNDTSSAPTPLKRLGLVRVPSATFSNDLEVSDRYQRFSAEILRLSLAGIAGIGFLLVNCLFHVSPDTQELPRAIVRQGRWDLTSSLACFGVAALGAVTHRFVSTFSLARHLLILRLECLGDYDKAKKLKRLRGWLFTMGWLTIALGGVFLLAGAAYLVRFFHTIMNAYGNS